MTITRMTKMMSRNTISAWDASGPETTILAIAPAAREPQSKAFINKPTTTIFSCPNPLKTSST